MDTGKEVSPLVGRIRPQLLGLTDDATTGYVDMSQLQKLRFLAQAGNLDGGAVAVSFLQAKTAGGSGEKALSGYGGTLSADASVLEGEVPATALDINNGFTHVKMKFLSDDQSGPTDTGPAVSGALFAEGLRATDNVTATDDSDETVGDGPAAGGG